MRYRDREILNRHLRNGAEKIARAAREISATFSKRIPLATQVIEDRIGIAVQTDGREAPNAAPFEYAKNHPLFGDREHWYKQPFRPYMLEARDREMPEIEEEMARALEDLFKERF